MTTAEQLIEECRSALRETQPAEAIRDIVRRAVADAPGLLRSLGTPTRSGIFPLHQAADLTVLNVVWAPGLTLYPHDHRMWAVIGVYGGKEDNVFYKRTSAGLARASAKRLDTGDTTLLGEHTIHAVANPLEQFTGAIHVYGGDFFGAARSEFDAQTLEERPFDMERAKRLHQEANEKLAALRLR